MKNSIIIFAFAGSIALSSCGESTTPQNASPSSEAPKQEPANATASTNTTAPAPVVEQPVELPWNFKGTIGNIPIKAQLNFEEAYHLEESGAIQFPISGYYFYTSKEIKIPFEGIQNGLGSFELSANMESGNEIFSGQDLGENGIMKNYTGTWTKGKKSLPFVLNAK